MNDQSPAVADRLDPIPTYMALWCALIVGYFAYTHPPEIIEIGYPLSVVLLTGGTAVLCLEIFHLTSGRRSPIWGDFDDDG